jgi:hypothetical protein
MAPLDDKAQERHDALVDGEIPLQPPLAAAPPELGESTFREVVREPFMTLAVSLSIDPSDSDAVIALRLCRHALHELPPEQKALVIAWLATESHMR